MKDSLINMIPNKKQRKKNFFDTYKKTTPSEKMQDELEPIPCPMHEDYDDSETNDDYVNKILKGSG